MADDGKPLRGSKICISQIGNPERREIREIAMKLGASFSPNFTSDVTHVICPDNPSRTVPKIKSAIKSNSTFVVNKEWVLECEREGRRIDEKKHEFFGNNEVASHQDTRRESDEEEHDHHFSEEELKRIEEEGFGEYENWKKLFMKKYTCKLPPFTLSYFIKMCCHTAGDTDLYDIYVDHKVDGYRRLEEGDFDQIMYIGKKITLKTQDYCTFPHHEITKESRFGFFTFRELYNTLFDLEKKEGRDGMYGGHVVYEGMEKKEYGVYSPFYGS